MPGKGIDLEFDRRSGKRRFWVRLNTVGASLNIFSVMQKHFSDPKKCFSASEKSFGDTPILFSTREKMIWKAENIFSRTAKTISANFPRHTGQSL